jgi:hypothetical protein
MSAWWSGFTIGGAIGFLVGALFAFWLAGRAAKRIGEDLRREGRLR